jgi:hypothetical protein
MFLGSKVRLVRGAANLTANYGDCEGVVSHMTVDDKEKPGVHCSLPTEFCICCDHIFPLL